jgi:hypothetical protein
LEAETLFRVEIILRNTAKIRIAPFRMEMLFSSLAVVWRVEMASEEGGITLFNLNVTIRIKERNPELSLFFTSETRK